MESADLEKLSPDLLPPPRPYLTELSVLGATFGRNTKHVEDDPKDEPMPLASSVGLQGLRSCSLPSERKPVPLPATPEECNLHLQPPL